MKKNVLKRQVQRDKILISYLALSTVSTVLFGQVTPKPNQKHHLDPIGLLMDGSGSGFLKSGSGTAKKPDIWIRNTGSYGYLLDYPFA